MTGEEAVPLEFKMLPAALKESANYETHAIGKWNLGDLTKDYTPTYRGSMRPTPLLLLPALAAQSHPQCVCT
jgi:hypothetical protein